MMNILINGVQAVLFDLDGVIVDSEPLHVKALDLTCRHFGFELLPEDIVRFKGVTERQAARYFFNGSEQAASKIEEFIAFKSRLYTKSIVQELELIEGAVDFINFCRASGWRISLTTSALPENVESVLQKFQLATCFEAIVSGGEVTHSKPHPEPYLKTAKKLDIEPQHCLVIEDSINGVRSGKSAGCRVIGITTTFAADELHAAGADLVVNSFADIRPS